ncbi:hypothetical protein Ddc_03600 [Ditylenchus destructor]|nr:hypothetical protein Ddc_03600 [Ditylenchus destructor]
MVMTMIRSAYSSITEKRKQGRCQDKPETLEGALSPFHETTRIDFDPAGEVNDPIGSFPSLLSLSPTAVSQNSNNNDDDEVKKSKVG